MTEYAIVDIETTGGYAARNGITEIAIYIHNGQKVTEVYETLIDPGTDIPGYITSFTGISNEMVAKAPSFANVAHRVYDLLTDRIFVAHSVNFDYSFIYNQLKNEGYELKCKKLCTVRLSRKIIPGYKSYSLGNICAALGIDIQNRHRAGGDASATVVLFEHLLKYDQDGVIEKSLKKGSKEYALPPHLPKAHFEALPHSPGVYYFYNHEGKVIYVGKAKSLKQRVSTHFSNNKPGKQKQEFIREIHGISYEECGCELLAVLLESAEIRRIWPAENRAQKSFQWVYGLYDYQDKAGRTRIGIDKIRNVTRPLHRYYSYNEAFEHLQQLSEAFDVCPKMCHIQTESSTCRQEGCSGTCDAFSKPKKHNKRAQKLIDDLLAPRETYMLLAEGRKPDESTAVVYLPGRYVAYGFFETDTLSEDAIPDSGLKELKLNQTIETAIRNVLEGGSLSEGVRVYTFSDKE